MSRAMYAGSIDVHPLLMEGFTFGWVRFNRTGWFGWTGLANGLSQGWSRWNRMDLGVVHIEVIRQWWPEQGGRS
ncbi:hypothetical protein F511_22053 [Dorcoceras hygrometricum]|uniref:Uncharacterized protein n=1 Tax=Dorcoceras hygrometricum TaxID=472368 RepID=A0A2Z7CC81_9LAMI|nr:hypothetical protein F511_22053 [Dorcoceras hygrometricum]